MLCGFWSSKVVRAWKGSNLVFGDVRSFRAGGRYDVVVLRFRHSTGAKSCPHNSEKVIFWIFEMGLMVENKLC